MVDPKELNVMVVEDDDFQRGMIVRMLRAQGVGSICEAVDGRQAIEIIRGEDEQSPDIAFCDLNMPEMDGLEFLRHLGEEEHPVAIVIISALESKVLTSAGTMTKMYGVKLLGVVEKPISPDQIKAMLSVYERTSNKWQKPTDQGSNFTVDEILQGIREHQFEPFLQPKVDLTTNQLVGAEALARWIHPEHGIIGPYAFIPKLEESDNIDELTFQMIEKSAAMCRQCHDAGYPVTISVNLSLVSLDDTTLADHITQLVKNIGLAPQHMVLEVTESAAMTEVAHALENLARLCMNGFQLSIDDYGTGYSSLQQLTRIPFSELKIDQSFVKGSDDNETLLSWSNPASTWHTS
ncbi:EAL domain-containing protein [Mariprofundus ferrooxydans]|uniref:EAL domain-containing response regulator n=1 Tax=Mariprofundus ferrooxydans TaxID=314344 RepID=UPI00039E2112|nr:EAL domain-containing response regulator [Mariprofundus ferrooxydans]